MSEDEIESLKLRLQQAEDRRWTLVDAITYATRKLPPDEAITWLELWNQGDREANDEFESWRVTR